MWLSKLYISDRSSYFHDRLLSSNIQSLQVTLRKKLLYINFLEVSKIETVYEENLQYYRSSNWKTENIMHEEKFLNPFPNDKF